MNQMTLITHADMYNATIPIFNLYHAVKYFLSHVGIQDFSLSDLVNPGTFHPLYSSEKPYKATKFIKNWTFQFPNEHKCILML